MSRARGAVAATVASVVTIVAVGLGVRAAVRGRAERKSTVTVVSRDGRRRVEEFATPEQAAEVFGRVMSASATAHAQGEVTAYLSTPTESIARSLASNRVVNASGLDTESAPYAVYTGDGIVEFWVPFDNERDARAFMARPGWLVAPVLTVDGKIAEPAGAEPSVTNHDHFVVIAASHGDAPAIVTRYWSETAARAALNEVKLSAPVFELRAPSGKRLAGS